MTIRQATLHDAPAIGDLLAQLGYPPAGDRIQFASAKIEAYNQPGYHLLVADGNAGAVAFIALHWFARFHSPGSVGRIVAFCVSEEVRSHGIGKRMLQAAEDFLSTQGCSQVEVTSNMRRTKAHEFYLNNGYMENSRKFIKTL